LQAQAKLPGVFVHVAWEPQLFVPLVHSFTSEHFDLIWLLSQANPLSTAQVAPHPSPEVVLPSSQASSPALIPSPQTVLHVAPFPT
jgi:hypothetical protein